MCRIKQQNILTFNADLSCQNKEQLLVVVINLTMDCRYCDINQSYATIIIAKYHFCSYDVLMIPLFKSYLRVERIVVYLPISQLVPWLHPVHMQVY